MQSTAQSKQQRPVIDLEQPGMLILHWREGRIAKADWDGHLAAWKELLDRAEPFVLLADVRLTEPIDAARRKEVARFVEAHRMGLRLHMRGAAVVAGSALHRGVITAMAWVGRPPFPIETFGDYDAALRWCQERLR